MTLIEFASYLCACVMPPGRFKFPLCPCHSAAGSHRTCTASACGSTAFSGTTAGGSGTLEGGILGGCFSRSVSGAIAGAIAGAFAATAAAGAKTCSLYHFGATGRSPGRCPCAHRAHR